MNNCELTQKQIAVQLELTEGAIINYKRNRIPKAFELLRIADYFGVTMEWLLTGLEREDGIGWKKRAIIAEEKLRTFKKGIKTLSDTVSSLSSIIMD